MTRPFAGIHRFYGVLIVLMFATLTGCGGSQQSGTSSSDSLGSSSGSFQSTARFRYPYAVAVDSSENLYVADTANNEIRLITPKGKVTTVDGVSAGLELPVSVTVDAQDDLYLGNSNEIIEVTPDRSVSTIAGSDNPGATNAEGENARFLEPSGTAVDSQGNIYVADFGNNEIRKISPSGEVTTFAGSTTAGSADGVGRSASFHGPYGVALGPDGFLYVSDYYNNQIRKISPEGVVTSFAGSGKAGASDGAGTSASFHDPSGIAVDSHGNVYVADSQNNEVRMITAAGLVSTLAGSTKAGSADGSGASAAFFCPYGLAVDSQGVVYVADTKNNEIREVTPEGVVSTVAGSTTAGNMDGTALPR